MKINVDFYCQNQFFCLSSNHREAIKHRLTKATKMKMRIENRNGITWINGVGDNSPTISIDHKNLENGNHNLHWTYNGSRILTGVTYDEAMYTLKCMIEVDNKHIIENEIERIKSKLNHEPTLTELIDETMENEEA